MRKSKAKGLQVVRLSVTVAIALIALAPAARSDGMGLGGTIKGSGPISYVSPCNHATISGTVNFTGVVSVFEEEGNSQVFVFVTYNAPNQTGTDGNTYNAHGRGRCRVRYSGPYRAGGQWVLRLADESRLRCSTNNNTLNFLAGTHAFVDVDSNQRPTAVPDVGVNAVCGK